MPSPSTISPGRGAAPSADRLLVLSGVVKHFGGVTALAGVDFDLRGGEIHALLGENGAGKSTLIKVLGGIHIPEAGTIHIDGKPARIRTVADAARYGIRIIHQELSLVPNLPIADNIYLGREPHRLGVLQRGRMLADARRLIGALGMEELPAAETRLAALTAAQQQLVEIARALSGKARILVLDEPTSSLSVGETEALFATLQRLRAQGVGIIYISHRLEEIGRLADRVTVLRDGQAVGMQPGSRFDRGELVQWMVGHSVQDDLPRPPARPGAVALRAAGLRNAAVRGVSFEVRYGEILGIAGLVGAGRSELARALFGIDRLDAGELFLDGRPVTIRNPRDALAVGLALVPEDRKAQGLVMTHSVAFNLALPWVRDWIGPAGPNWRRRREIVARAMARFALRAADPEQCIDGLSGGNQQKALVARWMEHPPKVLILDEPTRGVDVGAREEMFRLIASLVEEGMAVLLISSDLSEVLGMAHRVAVYRGGRIVRTAAAGDITLAEILEELTGAGTGEDK